MASLVAEREVQGPLTEVFLLVAVAVALLATRVVGGEVLTKEVIILRRALAVAQAVVVRPLAHWRIDMAVVVVVFLEMGRAPMVLLELRQRHPPREEVGVVAALAVRQELTQLQGPVGLMGGAVVAVAPAGPQ